MTDTPAFRRHALLPKRREGRQRPFLPDLGDIRLADHLGALAPVERRALAQVVETADLIDTPAGAFLLIPANDGLLDALAEFGAAAEDREPTDLEDGEETDDDTISEPNGDEGDYSAGATDTDLAIRYHLRALRQARSPGDQAGTGAAG